MKTFISLKPWQMVLVCILTAIALGICVSKTLCAIYIVLSLCSAFVWRKKYIDAINASKHTEMHDMSANMED